MSANRKKAGKASGIGQLIIPLTALTILLLFNLFRDPGFFAIRMAVSNSGNQVLSGNIISIIDSASALAIISMGMTLVTAACGGQDISVGAVGAIAGSFFVKAANQGGEITGLSVALGIILCILGTIAFMLFNGTLVAVFNIQPMIATLILFSCGRSIAYWINGSATPQLNSPIIQAMGMTIPGIPIPTPIFAVVVMALLLTLLFRVTNLRLYTQSVGINQGAARLNGINPTAVKLLSFVILGVCVAVAAVIGVSRLGQLNHKTLLVDIEMDAILAVAIGGNNLGGGRFRILGSVLGAYIIQMLTTTLYAMSVSPVNVKAYKAIVIIIIVVAGSPVIKNRISSLIHRARATRNAPAAGREAVIHAERNHAFRTEKNQGDDLGSSCLSFSDCYHLLFDVFHLYAFHRILGRAESGPGIRRTEKLSKTVRRQGVLEVPGEHASLSGDYLRGPERPGVYFCRDSAQRRQTADTVQMHHFYSDHSGTCHHGSGFPAAFFSPGPAAADF